MNLSLRWAALLPACAAVVSCAPMPPSGSANLPEPGRPVSDCPVLGSRGWSAWINAMPGPGAVRTLHITGEVDLPTPGYTVELIPGPADRMMPPGQRFSLVARPPGGMAAQIVTPTPARYHGAAVYPAYREILVGCGGEVLARIGSVETVQ